MSDVAGASGVSAKERVLHPWFVSQFGLGLCLLAGGFFLLPAYLDEQGYSSGDIGLVIALIGVGALVSPVFGRVADRLRVHRAVQNIGVAGAVLACAGFAVAERLLAFGLAAIVLGVAQAAVLSMNAAMVLGSRASSSTQSRSITALAAILIIGQAVGLLGISIGAAAGLSYSALFGVAAGVAAGALVVTATTNRAADVEARDVPRHRLDSDSGSTEGGPPAGEESVGREKGDQGGGRGDTFGGDSVRGETVQGESVGTLRAVLTSALGAFLFAVLLSQSGQLALETQLPVYYGEVFGIAAGTVSAALSVGVVLSLLSFVGIGPWIARRGPLPPWLTAQVLRVVGPIGLLVVGAATAAAAGVTALVALSCYLVMYLAYPLFNSAAPVLVNRVTTVGVGEAQGLYVGALAVCGITGPILGGWVADQFGLGALPLLPLLGAIIAIAVTVVAVRPSVRAPGGV